MTRQEAIILIRKIERMDKVIRIEGTRAVQERWLDLAHTLRNAIIAQGVQEDM